MRKPKKHIKHGLTHYLNNNKNKTKAEVLQKAREIYEIPDHIDDENLEGQVKEIIPRYNTYRLKIPVRNPEFVKQSQESPRSKPEKIIESLLDVNKVASNLLLPGYQNVRDKVHSVLDESPMAGSVKKSGYRLGKNIATFPAYAGAQFNLPHNLKLKAIQKALEVTGVAKDTALFESQTKEVPESFVNNVVVDYFDQMDQSYDYVQRQWTNKGENFYTLGNRVIKEKSPQALGEFAEYSLHHVLANAPQIGIQIAGLISGFNRAGLVSAGLLQASQEFKDLKDREISDTKASVTATAVGVIETLTESFGTNAILKNVLKQSVKKVGKENASLSIGHMLKQMVGLTAKGVYSEAPAEGLNEIMQSVARHVTGVENIKSVKSLLLSALESATYGGIAGGGIGLGGGVASASFSAMGNTKIDAGTIQNIKKAIPEFKDFIGEDIVPVPNHKLTKAVFGAVSVEKNALREGKSPEQANLDKLEYLGKVLSGDIVDDNFVRPILSLGNDVQGSNKSQRR